MNLLDNSGALRRLKLQNGLSRASSPTSSSYILSSKIKKAINQHLDDEILKRINPKNLSRIVFVNRIIDRIELLNCQTLEYVYSVYEDSLNKFFDLVSKPKNQIIKSAKQAERQHKELDDRTPDYYLEENGRQELDPY